MLTFEQMTMEITFVELDGKKLAILPQVPAGDVNEDVVARVSEMMEQVERSEPGYVALSTSASF
jgi:hypothetical protein